MAGELNAALGLSRRWARPQGSHLVAPSWSWRVGAGSNNLLGTDQPFPASVAECVSYGWLAPTALWLCDEAAGNLIDKVAGLALVPANAPYRGRTLVGAQHQGWLDKKLAVETLGHTDGMFQAAAAASLDITTQDFTFSVLCRPKAPRIGGAGGGEVLIDKIGTGGLGYEIMLNADLVRFYLKDAGGSTVYDVGALVYDGGIHLITVAVARSGNITGYVDGNATVTVAAGHPLTLTNDAKFTLSCYSAATAYAFNGQIGWVYVEIGHAQARTAHDRMWQHLKPPAALTTYSHTNPIWSEVAPGKVAASNANRLILGYDAGLTVAQNHRQVGLLNDGPATFVGNTAGSFLSWVAWKCTKGNQIGPDGLISALELTLATVAWTPFTGSTANFLYSPRTGMVGATNVPWAISVWIKRGAVGTTARVGLTFSGDPGGEEPFTLISEDTTPTGWTRYTATCTPVRAAHTRVDFCLGVKSIGEGCNFAHPALVRGLAVAPRCWLQPITNADVVMTPATAFIDNVGGSSLLNPAQGEFVDVISGFPGLIGVAPAALLWAPSAAASPNVAVWWSSATQLSASILDNDAVSSTIVATVTNPSLEHEIRFAWDCANPVVRDGGVDYYEALWIDGALAGRARTAPWTPVAAIASFGYGNDGAGAYPSRCVMTGGY